MSGRWRYRVLLLFVLCAVLSLPARALWQADHHVSPWGDRDLTRAMDLRDLPVAGAEASGGVGARVPGPALGVLMGVPWALTGTMKGVVRAIWLLGIVAVGALALTARNGPPGAAPLAALFWSTSTIVWETQQTVWNPAWLGAFLALGVLGMDRLVSQREPRWLVFASVFFAVAAQLHLTTLLLVVTLIPGVLMSSVPHLGRWALVALAAVGLLYAPTVVAEVHEGWTLVASLQAQPQLSQAHEVHLDRVWVALRKGLGFDAPWGAGAFWLHLGSVLLAWGAFVGAVRSLDATLVRPHETPGWVRSDAMFSVSVLLQVAWFAYDTSLLFVSRYALSFLPLLVLLGARGLAHQVQQLGARSHLVGLAVGGGIGGVMLLAVGSLHAFVLPAPSWETWDGQERVRLAIQEQMGWTVEDYVARTSIVELQGDGGLRRTHLVGTLHHLLPGAEHAFPGSGRGPCVTVVDLRPGRAPSDVLPLEAVRAMFPGTDHRALFPPMLSAWPVVWTPASGWCPAVLSNRYLATEQERKDWETVEGWYRETESDVKSRPDGGLDILLAWPIDLVSGSRFSVRLGLRPQGNQVFVSMDAHALRGTSFNGGLFGDGALEDPTIVAIDAQDRVVSSWPLMRGRVGFPGVLTPLALGPFEAPSGEVRLRFTAVVTSGGEDGVPLESVPRVVELPGTWMAPGGHAP